MGNQRAKDRKCFSCNTYQVWHCTSCMNSGSMKRCKKCDTDSSWRCGCRKDNKRNVKNKKCPKCKALGPRQGWEDEANGFKDSKDKDILGLHNLESKRKGQDRVWLGVFPNKMSGIIVITSVIVMVIVGVVLAYIFCKKKKKVMYLPGP